MEKEFLRDLQLRGIKVLDALLLTVPFAACWFFVYAEQTAAPFYFWGNWLVIAIFFVLYVTYGRIYEGFRLSLSRISEMLYSQGLALFLSDLILYLVAWLLTKRLPNPLPLMLAFAVQLVLAAAWCLLAHRWYTATYPPRRTAILYDERENMEQLINEYGLSARFDIRQNLPVGVCLAENFAPLDGVQTVFLCGVHSQERNEVLKYCIANNIGAYVLPGIGDVIMSGALKVHMFHLPMLLVTRYEPNPEYVVTKRALDIVLSLLALIITSPFMLLTALAIKIEDGGPVLYKQTRLTKDGKTFEILKFRSMKVNAESDGVARLSTGDKDDRITKVGRFIRSCRIDELPQLWNIFKGDMSIVGPRPERPEIAAQYEQELPEFNLRLQAKAGLTGYAQVYGKYNSTPYDKLQMDLMYLARPSLGEDLKIMLATVRILFTPESTEGVAAGQQTAMAGRGGVHLYPMIKRLSDIVLSATALILLSPVLAVVALCIKLDSPQEPVLFKQTRVGKDGKPFALYKFRTLRADAPHELSAAEIGNAREYTTHIGEFLRRTSLDELPQLFNILIGDMSIIGPRPLILHEEYIHARRQQYSVYNVRPGLTGLAQVNGRKDLTDDTKVWWDWVYVNDMCARSDQIIFWWTVWCVLAGSRRKQDAETSMVTDTVQIPLAEVAVAKETRQV